MGSFNRKTSLHSITFITNPIFVPSKPQHRRNGLLPPHDRPQDGQHGRPELRQGRSPADDGAEVHPRLLCCRPPEHCLQHHEAQLQHDGLSAPRPPPSACRPSAPTPLRWPTPSSRSPRTWVWVLPPSVSVVPVSVSVWSSLPSSRLSLATHLSVASSSLTPFWVSPSSKPLVCST